MAVSIVGKLGTGPYPRRRPPVATGANAEPILALPAAGTQQPAAVPSTSSSTYPAQPRSGWWTRNQQMPSTNLVDQLQEENNELKKFGEDLKARLEGDLAALKWEIRNLKEDHESSDRSTLTKQIEDLRAEMDVLRRKNEESEEVAHLWRNEALRPGNKRGSINVATPASEGRTVTGSRLATTPEETRRLRAELQEMQERRRCDQIEVDMLRDRRAQAEAKRIEAEKEILKLRDQMGKLSTDPTEAATPRGVGTNLKDKMDEAVNSGLRSGRRGRFKMTPGRFPRDGSAKKANDRFAFLIEERKRLKALKKSGLELLCKEIGIKYKTIDSTVDELAEINADKAFGGCSTTREKDDEGPEQDGFALSGPESVSYWKDRFANLVCVPIDHNAGDTLVCCPVIYRHGMDKLFLDNQGFTECNSEEEVRDLSAARFRDEGLTVLGKWDKGGNLGQSYVVPKHKGIAKWRPICPTYSECGVRASKTAAQAINRMLWDLPPATNFNLRSMPDLASAVGCVNKDLKKGEQLLSAAFDVKEMFCNLPHEAIIHAVQWVVDFWSMRGCSGILVKKRGKGAKLRKSGKQEGWSTISFDMLIKFVSLTWTALLFELVAVYFSRNWGSAAPGKLEAESGIADQVSSGIAALSGPLGISAAP
ncbi:hypothetical protein CBR_g19055 [Chara braunii]|uniref:Uncharacterized protein n=1 Tax=Chara braunii TaxID=69332 RepID=A0A388KXA5_CHABU|nr:hypothetical protein CBR_g19055 [Chara braunii]|eukprot:GBG74648.1 hypothetical protein CBR_g19055 [Chara braunii]